MMATEFRGHQINIADKSKTALIFKDGNLVKSLEGEDSQTALQKAKDYIAQNTNGKKKIFPITRTETCSQQTFIEAESEEEALAYAAVGDISWRENQDVSYEYATPGAVKQETLRGKYIERTNGSSFKSVL